MVAERLSGHLPGDLVLDAFPGVYAGLHGYLAHTGELVQAHHVPGHEDLGVAGNGAVVADHDAAGPVLLGAGGRRDGRRDRRRCHPGGPQHGARLVAGHRAVLSADAQPGGVYIGHDRVHVLLDAELGEGACRLGRQLRAERGERGVPAIEQQHPGVLGLDVTVFGAQRLGGHLADLPGQLDASGSGADQGEGEPAATLRRVDRGIGQLERAEDAAPDDQGMLDGLHAGRPLGELVVPEIRLLHPGRHDQVVVAELQLVPERPRREYPAPICVDAGHLGQHEVRVLVLTEQIPQRDGDLPLGQDPGRALV